MSGESELRERLRKIEALFAAPGSDGERLAAEAAIGRIKDRLAALGREASPIELQFSLADRWQRALFVALCRRYGLSPYRLHRQRHTTVMLKAPERFVREVLWPEFRELSGALTAWLAEATERIIREEVHGDTTDAPEQRAAIA